MLSIIIVSEGRPELLWKCLDSIKKSRLPEKYEIIIVTSEKKSITQEKAGSFLLNIKITHSSHVLAGARRNQAVKMAGGDMLYFLDDDVTVSKDIFENAVSIFNKSPGTSVLGGPNITPDDSTLFQKSAGFFLESIFGTFVMRNRYCILGKEMIADERSLILCNLAVRKEIFEQGNICFNSSVSCNEENILLQELHKRNYKMLYSPELIVYHARRRDIFSFCRQIAKYGRGRMQNIKVNPESFSPLFLTPVFFAMYLISLPFMFKKAPFYETPFALYFMLDLFFSLRYAVKKKNFFIGSFLMVLFPAGHLSYAIGFIGEFFSSKKYRV